VDVIFLFSAQRVRPLLLFPRKDARPVLSETKDTTVSWISPCEGQSRDTDASETGQRDSSRSCPDTKSQSAGPLRGLMVDEA